jgi:hypothetical protein
MASHRSSQKKRPSLRNTVGAHRSPDREKSTSLRSNPDGDRVYTEEEIREGKAVPETVIRIHETKQCDLDGVVYSDENELLRFCILTTIDGREFKICGECVMFLWSERHRSNAEPPA